MAFWKVIPLSILFTIYTQYTANSESITCPNGSGSCACNAGESGRCTLNCNSGNSVCRNDILTCRDGDECVINCRRNNGCRAATITCPTGADCTLNCLNGGNVCTGITVHSNNAKSFQCSGVNCPSTLHEYNNNPTIRPSESPTDFPMPAFCERVDCRDNCDPRFGGQTCTGCTAPTVICSTQSCDASRCCGCAVFRIGNRDVTDECLQPEVVCDCPDGGDRYCCDGIEYENECAAICDTCYDIDLDCTLGPCPFQE